MSFSTHSSSAERRPGEYLLFAVVFAGFVIASSGVIVSSSGIAIAGGGLTLVALWRFLRLS